MMMGRKRSRAAWKMASSGGRLPCARLERKVDHHDGVLLHDADEQDDADQGDDAEVRAAEHQGQQGTTPAEGRVERIVMGWM